MLGTGNHEHPPILHPDNTLRVRSYSTKWVTGGVRGGLDRYGGFYRPGHFKSFFSREFRLVDRPGVELGVLHDLVV